MLHGLVAELIVPAVKTKDFDVRAQGLICLGLCCLLDKVTRLERMPRLVRFADVSAVYSPWRSTPSSCLLARASRPKENCKSRSCRRSLT
jgi:hypothetical protein